MQAQRLLADQSLFIRCRVIHFSVRHLINKKTDPKQSLKQLTGRNCLVGNYLGGNSPGANYPGDNHPGANCPGGNFLAGKFSGGQLFWG